MGIMGLVNAKTMHYTTKEIEELDRVAVAGGLEIRQMMELAGFHMVSVFEKEKISKKDAVVVVCGKGNKGGDGLSAVRHLFNHGWKNISVVLADENIKPDPAHHCALLTKMNIPISVYKEQEKEKMQKKITGADVIIDSLIGYHLLGAPRGVFVTLIEVIQKSKARVISYDLPSGADATTGECTGVCVHADATLTLAVPKKLFETEAGKALSGTVYVADIGIPALFYDAVIPDSRPDFSNEGVVEYTQLNAR